MCLIVHTKKRRACAYLSCDNNSNGENHWTVVWFGVSWEGSI